MNLSYDNNGNLITGDGKFREYNEFNQLSKVYEGNNDSGDLLEEYVYHPTEDRILAKKVYNMSETVYPVEFVVYVNENFVREVYNLKATPHSNDTYYIKDEMGIVAEIKTNGSNVSNETVLFYHNDHLGSTSVITNESGGIVEKTFYKPFGGILVGGNKSRFDYEGKEFSEVTNDYDFHFRKYDPELRIFTQPDSGVQNVYDPQMLNRYSFERNNPYKYVDRDGKEARSITVGPGISNTGGETADNPFWHSMIIKEFIIYPGTSLKLRGELGKKYASNSPKVMHIGTSDEIALVEDEMFKSWQQEELGLHFRIIVNNDDIIRYCYKGGITNPSDLHVYGGYDINLIKMERNKQFKEMTGKDYPGFPERIMETVVSTTEPVLIFFNNQVESVFNFINKGWNVLKKIINI